eukprot:GHVQ01004711.1.p1 GENE.GHVQ01004711.1~~GHVQ01004711.1.p1  ORF type:complete len:103 (-),score=5.56 GHVQ01004711.1:854-1162(-)
MPHTGKTTNTSPEDVEVPAHKILPVDKLCLRHIPDIHAFFNDGRKHSQLLLFVSKTVVHASGLVVVRSPHETTSFKIVDKLDYLLAMGRNRHTTSHGRCVLL